MNQHNPARDRLYWLSKHVNDATFEVMLASVRLQGILGWMDETPPSAIDDLLLATSGLQQELDTLVDFTKQLRVT